MHASDVGGWSNRSLPLLYAFDRMYLPRFPPRAARRLGGGSPHNMRRKSLTVRRKNGIISVEGAENGDLHS